MILLLLVAGYLAFAPLLLGIVNCLVLARPKDSRKPLHRLSLLIPARNEATVIATTLRAALASDHTDFEVIVLDDHSTDETAAIVESFARTDPRLRLERAPALPPGWSGKMHACHHLGQRATGELMVFIDCDVTLQPHALSALDGFMGARPGLAYASGVPRQITPTLAEKLVVPLIDFLLLAYLPLPWMRRSRRPGLAAGCGQLVVVRRTAYMAAGGHGAIPRTLHDGLKLPRRFREMGLATDLFDGSGLASCRMYAGWRQVWHGFAKNASEGMATPKALPLWTLVLAGGQIVPYVLLGCGVPDSLYLAGASLLSRLIVTFRCRTSLLGGVLHPFGVAIVLAIQWTALINAKRKIPSLWRGRAYTAP